MSYSEVYIHHFGIMAPSAIIQKVRDFYVDILGLRSGYRPNASLSGYWLYSGECPIIHLTENEGKLPGTKGYFHHVALRCEDIDKVVQNLEENNISYQVVDIVEVQQRQLVVIDPAGTKVELNFDIS